MTNFIIPTVILKGIPINHKRARVRQALLLSLIYKRLYVRDDIQIEIYRDEFFCGKKGRIPQAAFYKIEK